MVLILIKLFLLIKSVLVNFKFLNDELGKDLLISKRKFTITLRYGSPIRSKVCRKIGRYLLQNQQVSAAKVVDLQQVSARFVDFAAGTCYYKYGYLFFLGLNSNSIYSNSRVFGYLDNFVFLFLEMIGIT